MAHPRIGACTRRALGLACAASLLGGCYGDWVSARTRPRRDGTPKIDRQTEAAPVPTDPCGAYLATVSQHCNRVLDGRPNKRRCSAELSRVMSTYGESRAAPTHGRAVAQPLEARCTQDLRELPAVHDDGLDADPVEIGPHCRRWAEALRERCVTPLSTPPPDLSGCGSEMTTFEGLLEGMVFGQAERYEALCLRAFDPQSPDTDSD